MRPDVTASLLEDLKRKQGRAVVQLIASPPPPILCCLRKGNDDCLVLSKSSGRDASGRDLELIERYIEMVFGNFVQTHE